MEILLLQNVDKVGKKNDLLVVGDGYALNYLLPQRLAIIATPTVRRRYAEHIRRRAEEREREKTAQQGVMKALSGKTVRFARKVTKTGKLYAAISAKAIADALKEQHGMELTAEDINIPDHIKSTGTFEIEVKVGEQTQILAVAVEAEKEGK